MYLFKSNSVILKILNVLSQINTDCIPNIIYTSCVIYICNDDT